MICPTVEAKKVLDEVIEPAEDLGNNRSNVIKTMMGSYVEGSTINETKAADLRTLNLQLKLKLQLTKKH